jgi:hypothetical protein
LEQIVPKYVVQVNAKNLLVNLNGRVAKYGFIANRVINAADPDAAQTAALQMLCKKQDLREMVLNEKDDPPEMDVIEIAEIELRASLDEQPAFHWYEMNPKRWRQFWR